MSFSLAIVKVFDYGSGWCHSSNVSSTGSEKAQLDRICRSNSFSSVRSTACTERLRYKKSYLFLIGLLCSLATVVILFKPNTKLFRISMLGLKQLTPRKNPKLSIGRSPAKTKSLALEAALSTGIDIFRSGGTLMWTGVYGGNIKPRGPLFDKRIGVIVASEFSDFQVYYLASYIGENGATCEFLLVDWVKWKFVRPNVAGKGVRGMWDLGVDPMFVLGGNKAALYKGLLEAEPTDYDAVVVIGGHSADVMVTEPQVIGFLQASVSNGAVVGSIGEGSMPLIAAGIIHGKRCTGNRLVDFMLRKIANFESVPVATDGNLITARDTVDTPAFLRALCKVFDSTYNDPWKGILTGKKAMLLIGEDYEDIEVIVPTMELMHRGAEISIGRFVPQFSSRSPHLPYFSVGSFGTTIPFQEIPDNYYSIKKLEEIKMSDFDVVIITGAFNPWNIVATGTTEWLLKAQGAGKYIAAVCHGPIAVAASGDIVKGKKMTGWLASKDSVKIMGGEFNPEWAAVIDGRLISGRTPPELPEFIDAITVALLDD